MLYSVSPPFVNRQLRSKIPLEVPMKEATAAPAERYGLGGQRSRPEVAPPMPGEPSNKRRLFRFPACIRVQATASTPRRPGGACLRDVSLTGLRLLSSEPFPAGERIQLRIPDADPAFSTEGEVVWSEPAGEGEYEIGVRLTTAFSPLDEWIYTQLREIETYRQTVRDFEGRTLSSEEAVAEWRQRFGARVQSEHAPTTCPPGLRASARTAKV